MLWRAGEVETTKPLRYIFVVSAVVEIVDAVKRWDEKQRNEFLDKLSEIDLTTLGIASLTVRNRVHDLTLFCASQPRNPMSRRSGSPDNR